MNILCLIKIPNRVEDFWTKFANYIFNFLTRNKVEGLLFRFLPYNKKNKMKADNSVNTPKEVRVLGPLIDKIMLVHEKNQ